MRFLIIARADLKPANTGDESGSCDVNSEAFSLDVIRSYMKYNEDMTKAGVLVASEGLNPNTPAIQIGVKKGQRTVIDGPFAETKEIVGGFYLIDVNSREEAIEWALQCPIAMGHETLEMRQLTELSDLPPDIEKLIRTNSPKWASNRYPIK